MYSKKNSWWWTEELSETRRILFPQKIWEISAYSWFIIRICHDARSPERQKLTEVSFKHVSPICKGQELFLDLWPFKIHYSLHEYPEDRSSYVTRGENLNSHAAISLSRSTLLCADIRLFISLFLFIYRVIHKSVKHVRKLADATVEWRQ